MRRFPKQELFGDAPALRRIAAFRALAGLLAGSLLLFAVGCATVPPASPAATVPAAVESDDVPSPLPLGTATAIAKRNDPHLRAARRWVSVEYWRKTQEALPPNPALYLSADPTEWLVRLGADLSSALNLGGARQHRVDAAQAREEQVALEVMRQEIALVQEVRILYADILSRQRLESLVGEKLALQRDALTRGREQLAAGDLSASDVLVLETALRDVEMRYEDVSTARRQSTAQLNQLLGRPLGATLDLTAGFELPDFPDTLPNAELLELGTLRRPEVALLAARIQEHGARLDFAEVQWVPQVEGGPLVTRPGVGESVVVGGYAKLTLPLFDHGQARAHAETAALRALEEELLAIEADILLEVHAAVLELQRVRLRALEHMPQLVTQAARVRTIAEQAEVVGGASRAQVSTARLRELDAQIRLANATQGLWIAQAHLAAAMGDRGPNLNTEGG